MFKLKKNLFLIFFVLCTIQLFSLEKLAIQRADQSLIDAYLTIPQDVEQFPLILLVQGSDAETVINNHKALADRFNPYGIAILSAEKRGINADGKDTPQFIEFDFFEYRLQDFSTILQALDHGLIKKWNGALIILGGSEGGKIAPKLALQFPSHVVGVILIGSGGGLSFGEELKFQIETSLNNMNLVYKFCFKIRDILIPRKIDAKYLKILEQPDSLEMWYEKTFRWWASYLKYDPLPEMLQINIPIYMIHGALDPKIPVESADAVKAAFDEASKHNITYVCYSDLEHSLKGRDDVYHSMIEWIKKIFQN
ncbi:MAG: alpha/beta hydrolase [Parachlamydiaceae bacterium]|nr:alpha/beta hydrolase [Parachlamydiaceae bacterium]